MQWKTKTEWTNTNEGAKLAFLKIIATLLFRMLIFSQVWNPLDNQYWTGKHPRSTSDKFGIDPKDILNTICPLDILIRNAKKTLKCSLLLTRRITNYSWKSLDACFPWIFEASKDGTPVTLIDKDDRNQQTSIPSFEFCVQS